MGKPRITTIRINAKCGELFTAQLVDADGGDAGEYDGCVPDFFPGMHYGDYVELDIDVATGRILNWKKPTQAALRELVDE